MTRPLNVMSFDIGIKNMAYCMISVKDPLKILDWRVIDISKNDDTQEDCVVNRCSCKNKTKLCKRKAKYVKNEQYYCEKHANVTSEYIVKEKRMMSTNLKKMKLTDLEHIIEEFSIPDIIDKKLNKKEIIEKMDIFFTKKCFMKVCEIGAVSAQHINLITLGRNMTKILDKVSGLNDVTHVILENQISPLASRMKTIQGMLAQYFIMRFGDSIIIEFVSSINKLKNFPKVDRDTNHVSDYKKHKTDAIYYTKEILSKNLSINSICQNGSYSCEDALSSKKKDDLCDCFLQGIWYLQKLKCIVFDEKFSICKVL